MKHYKSAQTFISDYLSASATDIRAKMEPVYNMYGFAALATKLNCSQETIRNYRRHSSPRKPTLQHYLLLCSLLADRRKT